MTYQQQTNTAPRAVDATYLIGVIRHLEKGLLGDDEYTRLRQAPTAADAVRVLADTVYGRFLGSEDSIAAALEALQARLRELQQWLAETLADQTVLALTQVRYDGLNLAAALIQYHEGDAKPSPLSPLGAINPSVIHSAIWHNTGYDAVPAAWASFISEQRQRETAGHHRQSPAEAGQGWRTQLLRDTQATALTIMHRYAHTPLGRTYLRYTADRVTIDTLLREEEWQTTDHNSPALHNANPSADSSAADIVKVLTAAGYTGFTPKQLDQVRAHADSTAYEHTWDANTLRQLAPHRSDATGYDAVLAFWFAVELEAKTIRLLLRAKAQGVAADYLARLQRPLYRATP